MRNRNVFLPLFVVAEPTPEGWLLTIEAGTHQIPINLYNTEQEARLARDQLEYALDVRFEENT